MTEEQKIKMREGREKSRLKRLEQKGKIQLGPGVPEEDSVGIGDVFSLMQKMDKRMDAMENRISGMERPGDNEFKTKVKEEDIVKAEKKNASIPTEIRNIVNEVLGPDFGIDIEHYKDMVGMRMTIIVPQRLSLIPLNTRPVMGENGEYEKDDKGNITMEEYYPEDRRSKNLTSIDSYDLVREHCEKIKKNIVLVYQKLSKPLPPFTK